MTTKYEDPRFKVPELPTLMRLMEEDKIEEQSQVTANLLSDICGPVIAYGERHGEISEDISELLAIDCIDALEKSMSERKMIISRLSVTNGVRIYVNRMGHTAPCMHEFFGYLHEVALKNILERHEITC